MPRYDRYARLAKEIAQSVVSGEILVSWSEDSAAFTYSRDGKSYRFDLATMATTETSELPKPGRVRPPGRPDRGRQFERVAAPDEKLVALSRDRNVFIASPDGKGEVQVTHDGDPAARIKNGVASWVYGEELGVRYAMWWSPDGKWLAYYRFDESQVKDYYVTLNEIGVQNTLDVEPYPTAGSPNPVVQLYVYSLTSKQSLLMDTRFMNPALGEYVYDVKWSEDSSMLFFNRTNRQQNLQQLCAAEPGSGRSRVLFEESHPQSWSANHPETHFLKSHSQFIVSSERDGYKNYYLFDLSGKLLRQLTHNQADAISILKVDEEQKQFLYTVCGPENPYFRQLHRCGLDGRHDELLTDPALDHATTPSPNGKWIVDVAQSPTEPPETRLLDLHGKPVKTLFVSDMSKYDALRLKRVELFRFPSADARYTLYGTIQFPSDFDPAERYPILLDVYGGPESRGIPPNFLVPNPVTELGFLVVNIAGRGTTGRGKAFRDAVYKHLGEVEIDDQNAGIRALQTRPWADLSRVGVFGTSYGGYATTMLLLRHPETFSVGCASSSVTDWHNYDSIYTERYMGLPTPADNEQGYQSSSAVKLAKNLVGKLMLYFGSADNNVHVSNTFQLAKALESAGKSYDMTVGADMGHTQMNRARMWEYFALHLLLTGPRNPLNLVWNRRARRLRSSSAP